MLKGSSPVKEKILPDGLKEIVNLVTDIRTMSAGVYLETKRLRSFDDKVETPQIEERVQMSMKEASSVNSDSHLEDRINFIKTLLHSAIEDLLSAASNIRNIV